MTSTTTLYPTSPKETLASLYLGKSIRDVPTPAAILDVAVVKNNCNRMLQACKSLDLQWRAHVKTHKTVEVTRLQLGEDVDRPAQIIVSTLEEAEFLLPLFQDYRSRGRDVNILYGLPIAPSQIERLFAVGRNLGPGSISVLIDHPSQVSHLIAAGAKSHAVTPDAYIKVNMGGDRAGVIVGSELMSTLVDAALDAHESGAIVLKGLYSHAGHSYGGDSRVAALQMLAAELTALHEGATFIATKRGPGNVLPLVLSVGASPTALSVQNILSTQKPARDGSEDPNELRTSVEAGNISQLFAKVRQDGLIPEIHAGVYPLLDLQQLAAHSLSGTLLSWSDLAYTVVAEIHSLYPDRGQDGTLEALVGAGGLALGREFCKAYKGMAMLAPWGRDGVELPDCDVEDFEGWIIGRFAQEHGILTWMSGKGRAPDELKVGQKVRLWPNHACITSSHFGWYFVVDSSQEGDRDKIVDIFIKTRGW
ncbi:hypothetical protein BJ170DRAFT_586772 [Xylariales sp. AK1849]|nr:hypothetical protein BJ170DRAFT_586772 [Xylariales sp. AK1849]